MGVKIAVYTDKYTTTLFILRKYMQLFPKHS